MLNHHCYLCSRQAKVTERKMYHEKKIGDRPMANKIGQTWTGQFLVILCDFKVDLTLR